MKGRDRRRDPGGNLVRNPRHLSAFVHEALSRMIREREVRAGDTIVESHVAELLGVSRTPLREAMQRLEAEGLLQKGSHRSYEVRRVDLKEYLQSLRVREVLEAEAAVLALDRFSPERLAEARAAVLSLDTAQPYDKLAHWRADDLVHNLFILDCGNDVMTRLLLSLRVTTNLFEVERLADRLVPDSREHERILAAIETRNAKKTRLAVASHIRSLFDFAVRTMT